MSQASQVFGHHTPKSESEHPEQAQTGSASSSMARNAIIVSAAFVLSRILGLLREMIIAPQFGTSPEMDAYVSAFRIPDLLFLTVMSGAFGAAFIPVFGGFVDRGDKEKASRLASAMLTWTGIVVLSLAAIAWIGARPLVYVVSPGFDAHTVDLAVDLMRILLLSPFFLGLGIACKGILEAQNQFTLPALSPLVYNVAIIVGAAFFAQHYGIQAVAWAVIIGAALHMAIQLPGVIRSGLHFRPTIDRSVEGLGEVARLLGPRVVGLAAFQLNFIAVNAFATTLGEGNASALNYAWQLLMLPHGVLALSISTVAFPSLAALYSRGDGDGFARLLDRTMRPLLFLSVPASLGLWLVGKPVVMVIFESGNFDAASTDLVNAALMWFAIGLVGYGLTEIVTRVFYAMRDTRTPVITGILTIILNLILCSLFIGSLGHRGLALSLSVTTAAEAIIMMLFLRHRSGRIFSAGFFGWLVKVLVAGAAMAAVIVITAPWLRDVLHANVSLIVHLLYFGISLALYVFTFLFAAWALRIPELNSSVAKILHRIPARVRSRMTWLSIGDDPAS